MQKAIDIYQHQNLNLKPPKRIAIFLKKLLTKTSSRKIMTRGSNACVFPLTQLIVMSAARQVHPLRDLVCMKRFHLSVGVILALAACSPKNGSGSTPTVAGVRSAIVAGNYAEAVDMAQKLATSTPKDPSVQLELARAQALQGNQGRALDAIELAVNSGLGNASQALADPAFDRLRTNTRFVALVNRASPSAGNGENAAVISAGSGADHVDIQDGPSGTHIHAGDVSLDTKF